MLVASPLAWGLDLLAFSRGGETLSPIIPAVSALLLALALRWDSNGAYFAQNVPSIPSL